MARKRLVGLWIRELEQSRHLFMLVRYGRSRNAVYETGILLQHGMGARLIVKRLRWMANRMEEWLNKKEGRR